MWAVQPRMTAWSRRVTRGRGPEVAAGKRHRERFGRRPIPQGKAAGVNRRGEELGATWSGRPVPGQWPG